MTTQSSQRRSGTQRVPNSTTRNNNAPSSSFPWRAEDDAALENGKQVERARYKFEIDADARDILEAAAANNGGEMPHPRELEREIRADVHESATAAVVFGAPMIITQSNNWDAARGTSLGKDPSIAIATIAYSAYSLDLLEAIAELDEDDYFTSDNDKEDDT